MCDKERANVSQAVINGAAQGKLGFVNPLPSQSQEVSGVPDPLSDGVQYVCCDRAELSWASPGECPPGEVSQPWEQGGGRGMGEEMPQSDTHRVGGECQVRGSIPSVSPHPGQGETQSSLE